MEAQAESRSEYRRQIGAQLVPEGNEPVDEAFFLRAINPRDTPIAYRTDVIVSTSRIVSLAVTTSLLRLSTPRLSDPSQFFGDGL